MSSKVTYRQQFTRCGKQRCRKCREGEGHGPYWYAYWSEKGRTVSKYIGIHLPPHIEVVQPLSCEQGEELSHKATLQSPSGPILRVHLLGQFCVERKNQNEWLPVDNRIWHRRRARALLGCLLTNPGRRLGREQVMELLWPNLDIDIAANRLNGAVHELRQILEPDITRPAASRMLRLERDILALADSEYIWVDAEAFESLLKQANTATDPEKAEQLLEEAASLYGGSYLLEELYSDWTVQRRDALQRSWVGLLLNLAHLRAERGAFSSAIEALDRLRTAEPTNETALQRLMILLTQLDRRGEALQIYRQHTAMLRRDYESEPLPETRKLYEELRQGHLPPSQTVKPQTNRARENTTLKQSASPSTSVTLSLPLSEYTSSKQEISFSRPVCQLGRHNKSPLVGRHSELETIRHVLLSVETLAGQSAYTMPEKETNNTRSRTLQITSPSPESKRPHFLLLLGEPGIGKTRLAEELSLEAYARGWAVAWSRTYEQEGTIPYRSWIDVLRTLLQGLSPSTGSFPPNIPINLGHSAYFDLERLSTLLPELAASAPHPVASLPHEQERLHLWETTLGLLGTLARTYPLLLVLDDLHWTDESSIELLAYLAHHLQDQRVLLVGTCRDAELASTHKLRMLITDLKREQAIVTLPVQPLTQSQIGTLVAHLPKDLVQSIQTQAAGNPFFAEELARYADATVRDTASLVPLIQESQKEVAQIRASSAPAQEKNGRDVPYASRRHSLPEAIAALLDRRLSRLSIECQALLGKAAVLGGSFELSQLLPMAMEHTEDTLLDLLEEALRAKLLTEEVTDAQIIYHFWHPLIVSHLYDRLSAARRTQLHRRAAEAIRATHAPSQQEKIAATIAYHLSKGGGDTNSIAHYAELAGNSAYAIAAYSEAQHHYFQAIQALMGERAPALDSTNVYLQLRHLVHHIQEKLFSIHADIKRICRFLEFIAECSAVQGNFEDARRLYEAILDLRTNEALQQPVCSPPTHRESNRQQEAQIQALLWREIGITWTATGEYGRAYECYERGKAVMVEAGVTIGAAWACLHLQYGVLLRIEGNYHEARRYLREALEMLEQVVPQAAYHQVDPYIVSYEEPRQVTPSLSSYNPAQPYKRLQTRTELALLGDPLDIGYVHEQLGVVAASIGRLSDALKHMHTALTIYEQRALVSEIARLCGNLGNIYIIKGEHASARLYLQRSLALAERTGDLPNMAFITNNLGDVAHRSGDLVEAETWFQLSLAHAERINDREHISWCSAELAFVQRDLGKLQEAATCIYRAIMTGRAIKSPRCTRYALVALGDLRIIEAIIACKSLPTEKNNSQPFSQCQRLLLRAKSTLQRAITLEGLEAEPMIGAKLLLATVHFLLDDLETAWQITVQTMAEAQQHETTRVIGRAHRLLGRILAAQGQHEQADTHYEQALEMFQERTLRLDYARTLLGYGVALMQRNISRDERPGEQHGAEQVVRDERAYQQGLGYLHEAHTIFIDCQATVDRVWAEHMLAQFAQQSMTVAKETFKERL